MVKKLNEELRQFDRLQGEGIPFDQQVLNELKRAARGLSLFKTGTIVENYIFDLDQSGWGCMLSIAIQNDSDRVICVQQYSLKVPAFERDFRWLEDPHRESPRKYSYSFPPHGPVGLDREDVLNHRIGRKGRLNPGDSFEGLLLGTGQGRLPEDFPDRQAMPAELTIVDGRGDCYELDVKLCVRRQKRVGIKKPGPSRLTLSS